MTVSPAALRRLAAVLLPALLLPAAALAFARLSAAKSHALAAQNDLAATRRAAAAFRAARAKPAVAGLRELEHLDLARAIESAAQAAGIGPGDIDSIDPAPPRQLGNSPFKEKPTDLRLRRVTLRQLIVLLHTLAEGPAALTPRSIRLSVPSDQDKPDLWKAELTLAYLLYSPLDPAPESHR